MESKPQMPFETAKQFLAACTHGELADGCFSDKEIWWTRDGRQVAYGYIGSTRKSVVVKATKKFAETQFSDADAEELDKFGQPGERHKNDEGDPRLLN